jgi:hypothetical protein
MKEEDDDDVASKHSRASWEMSDSESIKSSIASASTDSSGSESEHDSDSDDEVEDRYDMMVRHLWGVGERSGWFRDAEFDGLVSIRWVPSVVQSLIAVSKSATSEHFLERVPVVVGLASLKNVFNNGIPRLLPSTLRSQ